MQTSPRRHGDYRSLCVLQTLLSLAQGMFVCKYLPLYSSPSPASTAGEAFRCRSNSVVSSDQIQMQPNWEDKTRDRKNLKTFSIHLEVSFVSVEAT